MKRFVKLCISFLVRAVDAICETFCRFIGRPLAPRCIVIYYHTIPSELKPLFIRQLDVITRLWLSRSRPLPLPCCNLANATFASPSMMVS